MKPKNNGKMQIKIESVSSVVKGSDKKLWGVAGSLVENDAALQQALGKQLSKMKLADLKALEKNTVMEHKLMFVFIARVVESAELAADEANYSNADTKTAYKDTLKEFGIKMPIKEWYAIKEYLDTLDY